MAQVAITNTVLNFNEAAAMPTAAAVTNATDGCAVSYTGKEDGKILLILTNNGSSAAIAAKVLKGNAIQGTEDLSISIPASSTKLVVIESGKFVNSDGTNKGKAILNGSTDLRVAAIELP